MNTLASKLWSKCKNYGESPLLDDNEAIPRLTVATKEDLSVEREIRLTHFGYKPWRAILRMRDASSLYRNLLCPIRCKELVTTKIIYCNYKHIKQEL